MSWPGWSDDEALMRDLGEAVRRPEVSDRVRLAAQNAMAWRDVRTEVDEAELELVALRHDSVLEGELAGVRGGDEPRTLEFSDEAGELGVELEIGHRGIVGQLLPPGPGEVRLTGADGPIATAHADEIGRFAFSALPRGPIRIRCIGGGRSFVTEWVPVWRQKGSTGRGAKRTGVTGMFRSAHE